MIPALVVLAIFALAVWRRIPRRSPDVRPLTMHHHVVRDTSPMDARWRRRRIREAQDRARLADAMRSAAQLANRSRRAR